MWNITLNTYRELIRNKLFSLIGVFGITFILISFLLETLSLGEIQRMLFDFGLSFMELTGFMIVLVIGGQMIFREIEGKTIYLILSKPTPRSNILLGKFFGFSIALFGIILLQTILLSGLLILKGAPLDGIFFLAILGIYLKLLILLAVTLFFSTFVSPMVAMFSTIGVYMIGHGAYYIIEFAIRKNMILLGYIGKGVATIFPNFTALNLKNFVGTQAPLDIGNWLIGYGIGVLYLVCILLAGILLFRKKTFDNA